MAEWAEGSIDIEANPARVMEAIAEFESYPQWAVGVQSAEVLRRDTQGRPFLVHFVIDQMGVGAEYTLEYSYAPKDGGVSWASTEASGVIRATRGHYVLEPSGNGTRVTYRTSVDLAVKVPALLRRQGEKMVISQALQGLKKRVEAD